MYPWFQKKFFGRRRAPVYSGMMSYEKAVRELALLGFMFEMLIVVAGVGVDGR